MKWDLVGHEWAVDLLQRQMQQGSLHHAYLISGPEGVGRTTLAMVFAQALLCEAPPAPGETCGVCRACRQVPERTYPDLHIVERLEEKQGVAIDQVRELQRQLALAPLAGGRRVAFVIEVDRASAGAANALLKTLEEPPPRVVMLLTATDTEETPATIVSRCEVLALRPVTTAKIAQALEGRGAEAGAALEWARLSSGRPEWARALMEDGAFRKRREEHAAVFREVMAADLPRRFALADAWKADAWTEERLSVWLSLAGEDLGAQRSVAEGRPRAGNALANIASARRTVEAISRTLNGLRHNVNARLALEWMMLELPRPE